MDRAEASQPKYTPESAVDVLVQFGLEKEDLEHLISYPEDQITPETLPFILRQIRIQKAKKASDANRSKPSREPAPDQSHASGDSWRGPGLAQKDTPSPLVQTSKVIDYGHMSKYAGNMEEEVQGRAKRAEGDNLLTMDNLDRSSCGQDQVQQVGRSSSLATSSLDRQMSPSSYFSSLLMPTPLEGRDLGKPALAIAQSIFPHFSLPKQDTDLRGIKSQAPKSSDFEQVQAVLKPILKPQPQQQILHRIHPSRPDVVVLGGDIGGSDRFQNIAPAGGEKSKKQQVPSLGQNIKEEQSQKKQSSQKPPETQETTKAKQQPSSKPQQPSSKPQPPSKSQPPSKPQALLPTPVFAPMTRPPAFLPTSVFAPMARPQFHPVPRTLPFPSLLNLTPRPLCIPGPSYGVPHPQNPAHMEVGTSLPKANLMRDYAAATPRVFPHLCSLCNKECVHLKDWLTHQNTNFHLENCKVLRKRYPEWNGEVVNSCEDTPNIAAPTPESKSKKPDRGSHSSSRSVSPRRQRSSEPQQEKNTRKRTPSRSPHSSRHQRRSRSFSSTSPDYRHSRSRSYERRGSRRSQERDTSSRRSDERRSTKRRRSSSRSRRDRHSSPKRSHERRSPAKRSRESSATSQNSQDMSTKADILAKKLMKTSVVQSLSRQTDLETMVKTLAPALLAELAKMKSTSFKASAAATSEASSSSSAANKKPVDDETTSDEQKLSSEKAIVCFEPKEDADKIRKESNIKIKGLDVIVQEEKEGVPSEQEHNPQKKLPSLTEASKTQTSKSTSASQVKAKTVTVKKVPVKAKLSPTCKDHSEAPKAKLTKANASGDAASKKVNIPDKKLEVVAKTTNVAKPLEKTGVNVTVAERAVAQQQNPDATITAGERMCEFLLPNKIATLIEDRINQYYKKTQLLISSLPADQHSYCVQDIIQSVKPFASSADEIYVLPQSKMAFVELFGRNAVLFAMYAWKTTKLTLKNKTLEVGVLKEKIPMSPKNFYRWLMGMTNYLVNNNPSTIIFIKGITPGKTASLRRALWKIGGVQNFLPLHDKVFVEFENDKYADFLGVWYTFHNQCPAYQISRLGIAPESTRHAQTFPVEAMPKLAFAGATVDTATFGIPEYTISPFYLTMRTIPYLFNTSSPVFIIPKFLTVKRPGNIKEAIQRGASSTVMLTNLPRDGFRHEDVAMLAWPYFSQKDLRSLYYNVIALPLQRRAFVYFSDWVACGGFVRSHLKGPKFMLNGRRLAVHFVMEHMTAQNSEENMYMSLMQLSNSKIGEVESLAKRLLCVKSHLLVLLCLVGISDALCEL
ncbi:uncharacterized protein LOC130921266 isoform X2 [Corythoichthys intestinalis]|uniref:uncharacterized protein LOC130921266 isoform X2 n=1 Tax=Corythoichthys intestinalis TaxID=161448 RepID=UPI0025A5D084|nr:uncharacterized protein LOC130921266 isoform X2 [Corythoichthys intestinalis]